MKKCLYSENTAMCVLYFVFDKIVKVRECRMRLEQGRASEICAERCKRLGRVDRAPCILSDPANKNWVGGSLVGASVCMWVRFFSVFVLAHPAAAVKSKYALLSLSFCRSIISLPRWQDHDRRGQTRRKQLSSELGSNLRNCSYQMEPLMEEFFEWHHLLI